MFVAKSDPERGVTVGVYLPPTVDDDHAESIAALEASDRDATARGIPHVVVLVTYMGMPEPNSMWRKRMAASNNAMRAHEYFFALVSPSALQRHVLTAVRWLTRGRLGHHMQPCKDFEHAAEWIRDRSERAYPELEALYAAALSEGSAAQPGQPSDHGAARASSRPQKRLGL